MDGRASVLVIDDEPGLRDLLTFELSQEGFDVAAADSGLSAVSMAKAQKFDVAITDFKMPGMDGLETLMALKGLDSDIEVIVATGYSTIETAIACMRQGAYDYIHKPYNLAELSLMLDRALERKRLHGLVALYEVSQALLTTRDPLELGRLVVERGRQVIGADAAYLMSGDGEWLVPSGSLRVDRELTTALTELVADGAPKRLCGGLAAAIDRPIGAAFRSALVFPLQVQDQPLGVLQVLRTHDQPDFNTSEQRFGTIFAAQVAMALENARLYTSLQSKAITDDLTGLYSRRFLFDTLQHQLKRVARVGPPILTCLMVDVDHFKQINDQDGHLAGDDVLRRVARCIQSAVRESDLVARYGGEEFVVLLPHTEIDGGQIVAEKIRTAIATSPIRMAPITVSIGIASHRHDPGARKISGMEADHLGDMLLNRADMALYRAKAEGRNCICVWGDPSSPPGSGGADPQGPE